MGGMEPGPTEFSKGDVVTPTPRSTTDRRDAAFERYVVPELEVLFRVARSLTRHDQDAEDLVQETLLRAYRAADRFDGASPRAWLLTILRNAEHNRQRKRPLWIRLPEELAHDAHAAPETGQPDYVVIRDELSAELLEALRRLPEKFRSTIVLVDIDRLTYEEAATVLGVPTGTIMSRLHRARRKMRHEVVALRARDEREQETGP